VAERASVLARQPRTNPGGSDTLEGAGAGVGPCGVGVGRWLPLRGSGRYQPRAGSALLPARHRDGGRVRAYPGDSFPQELPAVRPTGDEYSLWFSPGDFKEVQPSLFSDEDYLPSRPRKHDYNREIKSAWKKTANGYSCDLAIPVSFFDGGKFTPGYEIGLAFNVQKVFPSPQAADPEEWQRIVFTSKADQLFHASINNPASLPRLVLVEAPSR
jgi:hypothetical protein